MYLYLIFIALVFFSCLETMKVRIKKLPYFHNTIFWIFIFTFFFLSTFRWERGTDWDPYYMYYLMQYHITCKGYMEPGFTFLTSVNSTLFNYTTQLGSVAFLSIIPIALSYRRFSPFPILALLIWFSTSLGHIFPVRQSIAIALYVFSWEYIHERNFKLFIVTILIATTFHFTAIIAIPTFFIWNKIFSKQFFIYTIVILSLFSLLVEEHIIGVIYGLFGGGIQEKLEVYLGSPDETFGSAYSASQILIRGIINRSLFFFISLILLDGVRQTDSKLNAFINLYFYSFCLFLLLTPLSPALGRFCSYTDMAQSIIIPYIFQYRIKTRLNFYLLYIIIIGYFCLRFKGVVHNYYDLYIPYNSVFSSNK